LSERSDHEFSRGQCIHCSIREQDSIFKMYQFCSDELREFAFVCDPTKNEEISKCYRSTGDIVTALSALVEYRIVEKN
jgi:hypothetical protein